MRRFRKSSLAVVAALMVSVAVLVACGDADDGDVGGDARPTEAATATPTAAIPEAGVAPADEPTSTVGTDGSVQFEPATTPTASSVGAAPQATDEPDIRPEQTPTPPAQAAEAAPSEPPDEKPAEPENPAPELLTTSAWYNAEPLALSDLRGGPVLLVFWNTY